MAGGRRSIQFNCCTLHCQLLQRAEEAAAAAVRLHYDVYPLRYMQGIPSPPMMAGAPHVCCLLGVALDCSDRPNLEIRGKTALWLMGIWVLLWFRVLGK